MSEDITYCMNKCNDMKCFRNKRHIKLLIPHSFSFLEGTEDCHKMQKRRKENKTMTEQTRTCATCTENDGGLCDLKGILIEDDDTCERWRNKQADWREHMLHTFLAGH